MTLYTRNPREYLTRFHYVTILVSEPLCLFRVQTFCIGMEGSPDVEHARLVAQYLNTEHHEIFFTAEEGFHAISDVIYALETFDVITIRGAVGMYLMVKYIRENTCTAVLFSGDKFRSMYNYLGSLTMI